MSRGMKLGLVALVLVGSIGGIIAVSINKKKNRAIEVRLEQVARRDLVSAVTASGKIEAQTKVDISADVTGRIIQIGVKEGDLVKKGQFLIQIDPVQFEGAVSRGEALVATNAASLVQARTNRDQAKRALDRTAELQRAGNNLISKESVEQAQQAYDVAVAIYASNEAQVEQARASLKEAKDNLARTRLFAPITGRVVRLAVEEGEVAVPGTFSRETGLLMTIADMSVILAKVQVDETDVVRLQQGDSVQVTIDAFPDTAFVGRVTKVSNSAQLTATATNSGSQDRAVDFDVEVTLSDPPADIRPDLSCTARVVTDTRQKTLSVPIIALTVREHEPVPNEAAPGAPARPASTASAAPAPGDSAKGVKKKEREGVFVVRDGIASFRPVKVGIAGDEFFEVLEGIRENETIVAGTYQVIRDLKDGDKVRQGTPEAGVKKEAKAS
jgi:HlyD family secretion protein